MATIRHTLQKEVFDITEEKIIGILHVTKPGKKKKKISFLCAAINKEKPVQAFITQIKETEKDSFKKKNSWPLVELQIVDGKDENKETAELDLTIDRIYKWVASSVPEKHSFIQVLWKLCCRYLPKQKPLFINVPPELIREDTDKTEGKVVIAPGENFSIDRNCTSHSKDDCHSSAEKVCIERVSPVPEVIIVTKGSKRKKGEDIKHTFGYKSVFDEKNSHSFDVDSESDLSEKHCISNTISKSSNNNVDEPLLVKVDTRANKLYENEESKHSSNADHTKIKVYNTGLLGSVNEVEQSNLTVVENTTNVTGDPFLGKSELLCIEISEETPESVVSYVCEEPTPKSPCYSQYKDKFIQTDKLENTVEMKPRYSSSHFQNETNRRLLYDSDWDQFYEEDYITDIDWNLEVGQVGTNDYYKSKAAQTCNSGDNTCCISEKLNYSSTCQDDWCGEEDEWYDYTNTCTSLVNCTSDDAWYNDQLSRNKKSQPNVTEIRSCRKLAAHFCDATCSEDSWDIEMPSDQLLGSHSGATAFEQVRSSDQIFNLHSRTSAFELVTPHSGVTTEDVITHMAGHPIDDELWEETADGTSVCSFQLGTIGRWEKEVLSCVECNKAKRIRTQGSQAEHLFQVRPIMKEYYVTEDDWAVGTTNVTEDDWAVGTTNVTEDDWAVGTTNVTEDDWEIDTTNDVISSRISGYSPYKNVSLQERLQLQEDDNMCNSAPSRSDYDAEDEWDVNDDNDWDVDSDWGENQYYWEEPAVAPHEEADWDLDEMVEFQLFLENQMIIELRQRWLINRRYG